MNVKELIEKLQKLPPDLEIWLQVDSEGNAYNKLRGVDDNAALSEYHDGGDYTDSIGVMVLTDWMKENHFTEEDLENGEQVLVLFP